MIKSKIRCCMGCTDRVASPNCHDTCVKYIREQNEWANLKNEILADRYSPFNSYKASRRRKNRKGET